MDAILIRLATKDGLPWLTEIYNYYVVNTPVTCDIEPYTVERRATWFQQFGPTGRYRLLVAEENGGVVGYAGTTRFRPKAAYDTTVETTIYCDLSAAGKGICRRLDTTLFETIACADLHPRLATYALPNPS